MSLDWRNEINRQIILDAHRSVVETALDESIPDDLNERTLYLEEIVAQMRLFRLTIIDRVVLSSIGNLLIDSGIRKGRSLYDPIPPEEVERLRGKAVLYARYSHGRL